MQPRHLLILDFVGAIATFLVTMFVLASEWLPTGLPSWLLRSMALVAASFACLDFVMYFFKDKVHLALATIAILNVAYCIASICICFLHYSSVTLLGWIYFAIEVPVVLGIAYWEWSVSKQRLPDSVESTS